MIPGGAERAASSIKCLPFLKYKTLFSALYYSNLQHKFQHSDSIYVAIMGKVRDDDPAKLTDFNLLSFDVYSTLIDEKGIFNRILYPHSTWLLRTGFMIEYYRLIA